MRTRGARPTGAGRGYAGAPTLALLLALGTGCRGTADATRPPPAPTPMALAAEAAKNARAALPDVRPALADPRLARAAQLAKAREDGQAALAIAEARAAAAGPLAADDACAWDYVEARLALAADQTTAAATAFDRAASAGCPLAGYARMRGAQAYARAGQIDEALARASAVPPELAARDDVHLVIAEALYAKGERARATDAWRAALAAQPRGPRWVEVSVRLANALLDRVALEGEGGAALAEEALELSTRVVAEAPRVEATSGALAARLRALGALGRSDTTLGDDVRARQAQAYLDAGDNVRALSAANALRDRKPRVPLEAEVACRLGVTRAQASTRGRAPGAADAWGEAIGLCAGREPLVTALFGGAKASAQGGRADEARARFARVEAEFPRHRFADDARFHAALIALDGGDEARFEDLLLTLPDVYPEGDMGSEGLFRVALLRMQRGRWADAEAPLARILERSPDDRHWATAGRAAYFLGRAAAARGDAAAARARWARVVTEHPLAYYMTQAYARLADGDPARARGALDEALDRDAAPGPLYTREHAELKGPAFARATHLLEVGELDLARRELGAAGCAADGVDPEVAWTVAHVWTAAGYPEIGHGVARRGPSAHLAHYPVGRWRVPWELAFPRVFEGVVLAESGKNGISPALTWGIMREESGFVAEAKSASNAFGLMQLIVPTARGVARGTGLPHDEQALKRPEVSVALGTKLLAQLRGAYGANPALAIAAYNGGGGAVGRWVAARGELPFDLWVETIPYEETRGYLKRVLASEAAYAFLYARAALDEVLLVPPRVTRASAAVP